MNEVANTEEANSKLDQENGRSPIASMKIPANVCLHDNSRFSNNDANTLRKTA